MLDLSVTSYLSWGRQLVLGLPDHSGDQIKNKKYRDLIKRCLQLWFVCLCAFKYKEANDTGQLFSLSNRGNDSKWWIRFLGLCSSPILYRNITSKNSVFSKFSHFHMFSTLKVPLFWSDQNDDVSMIITFHSSAQHCVCTYSFLVHCTSFSSSNNVQEFILNVFCLHFQPVAISSQHKLMKYYMTAQH